MQKNSSVERNRIKESGGWEAGKLSSASQSVKSLPAYFMMGVLLSWTFVAGCQKEEAPPLAQASVKKVAQPVQAVTAQVLTPEYVYDPAGKRDPFKSFIDTEKKARPTAPATPLQSFDINALKLVGVMMLPGKKIAIIEDPSGKGYHVKVGTLLGMNDGVVIDVLSDEVVIEEKYLDATSHTQVRKVTIKIPKEELQGGVGR